MPGLGALAGAEYDPRQVAGRRKGLETFLLTNRDECGYVTMGNIGAMKRAQNVLGSARQEETRQDRRRTLRLQDRQS